MIEVSIKHVESEVEMGRITIENISVNGDTADYSIRFGVDRLEAVGLHQRSILGFPRNKYNVLGLLRQALNTLDPSELELNGDLRHGRIEKKELGWDSSNLNSRPPR